MTYEQLILLENDDVALKLATAWETFCLEFKKKSGKTVVDQIQGGKWFTLWAGWAETAGLHSSQAQEKGPMLIMNEICYPDGRVDEKAKVYIRRQALERAGIKYIPESK